MMPSLMMMTSTRAGVTTIRLSIDKGKIFLSLTFFHHFLILYILYCLQLQCYKNSVCLVLCLALQLQLIEFSKGGAAMHDSVVLDLCTCWDRIFQHFSNISQSCVSCVYITPPPLLHCMHGIPNQTFQAPKLLIFLY